MSNPESEANSAVYTIQGRKVEFPVVVRHASAGSATFLVPAGPAQALIPLPDFEVAQVLPGRALCSLAIIDYKDNDLGDYNEVSIAFFVRPRGDKPAIPYLGNMLDMLKGRLGTFIVHLPVDQEFTCEAGSVIWGFPKTVQQIDLDYSDGRATCKLVYDGEHALTLSLPRGGDKSLPESTMTGYTSIEGVPHTNQFVSGAEGFGIRLGGAEMELGKGLIADQLRSLGFPRKALMTTWMEKMYATFGPAVKLPS